MKRPEPYSDRLTEKNISDFADMLRDAAAARSYASCRSWTVGTDGGSEWAIASGWTDRESLEVRFAIVSGAAHEYPGSFAPTDTGLDSLTFRVEKDTPKPVIVQQLHGMLSEFLAVCGGCAMPEAQEEPAGTGPAADGDGEPA